MQCVRKRVVGGRDVPGDGIGTVGCRAQQHGAAYHLVRVYGTASADVRLLHIKDPAGLWRQRLLTMLMAL